MRSLLFAALLASACASPPPYACSTPIDATGRGIALCHDPSMTPVCDSPGDMARYDPNSMGGYTLTGGVTASCDADNQAVCPDRTISPHCITQPTDP